MGRRPVGGRGRRTARRVIILLLAAAAYQAIALAATVRHRARRPEVASSYPPVSILKPIRGLDPKLYDAIRSHALQDYPDFEILCGVASLEDPAVKELERLRSEFPDLRIRLIHSTTTAPNGKVAVLMDLASRSESLILVVNDSDISVPPDYLRTVVSPLQNPSVGLVTCLYRASATEFPARFEALGVATDFVPGVLVAPLFGVNEFALGSTLAFRRSDLDRIGGFASIADYLADDYQLGAHLRRLGLTVHLSKLVVETRLSGASWGEVWQHQLRWARTIRVSRPFGYLGIAITNATVWAICGAFSGLYGHALALMALRVASGLAAAMVLRDRQAIRRWYLMPVRDLFGFAVWVVGLFGHEVQWRDSRLVLDQTGRIAGNR